MDILNTRESKKIVVNVDNRSHDIDTIFTIANDTFLEAWIYDEVLGDYKPNRIQEFKEFEDFVIKNASKKKANVYAKTEFGLIFGNKDEEDLVAIMPHDVLVQDKTIEQSKDIKGVEQMIGKIDKKKRFNKAIDNVAKVTLGVGALGLFIGLQVDDFHTLQAGAIYMGGVAASFALAAGSYQLLNREELAEKKELEAEQQMGRSL